MDWFAKFWVVVLVLVEGVVLVVIAVADAVAVAALTISSRSGVMLLWRLEGCSA